MNKNEVITIIISKLGNKLPKKDVASVVNTLIETIKESVLNNQKVSLKSFLTFEPIIKEAKNGKSFGKEWSRPDTHSVKVKVSSAFKNLLEQKEL